jgi:cytidylate kinase
MEHLIWLNIVSPVAAVLAAAGVWYVKVTLDARDAKSAMALMVMKEEIMEAINKVFVPSNVWDSERRRLREGMAGFAEQLDRLNKNCIAHRDWKDRQQERES